MEKILFEKQSDRLGAGTSTLPSADDMHILVVDDDVWVRNAVVELLRREGYEVSSAEDGEAAYAILCNEAIDLLITDEDMPRLRGLDLLRRMRKDNQTLPAILISGCLPWDEPDLEELLTPGMALEKPFAFGRLLKEVQGLTAHKQARAQ